MAATSLLARLGFRAALVGSAASLVYAAPIADGNVSNDAHTYASRTGWYHPTPTSMGFVASAVEQLRFDSTGVTMGLTGQYAKWDETNKYFDIFNTTPGSALSVANVVNGTVSVAATFGGGATSGGAAIQSAGILVNTGSTLTANAASIGDVIGARVAPTAGCFIGGGGGAVTTTTLTGLRTNVDWRTSSASTHTVNTVYGVSVNLTPTAGGGSTLTATNVYAFRADVTGGGIASAITNFYGLYLATPTGVLPTITNRWGVYQQDPLATNYFAGLVHLAAAENHAITRVSGNTALDATHFSVEVDASGGPVTITLPDSTGAGVNGRIYNIKKIDNSGNAVTIARSGADTIDGATSQSLTAQWQARTVQARAATPGYAIF